MDKKTKLLMEAFQDGTCTQAYALMGCHRATRQGRAGYIFRVWAPNARQVSVVADFNFWNTQDLPMAPIGGGIWEVFTDRGYEGCPYKYYVIRHDGSGTYKADPYATCSTPLPDTSSVIYTEDDHVWSDLKWMRGTGRKPNLEAPMNIYEMHLGSWRQKEDGSCYTYEELAELLPPYLKEMGYTHVEFMPLAEYPFDPSWGYQITGYYAPTARYGHPRGLKKLVNNLHKAGIGVILDWVPAHFPKDAYGLYEFDGTCCYEVADPTMNEHPDWTTRIFDFGRYEVKSFLVSNAVYWLEQYHIDGLRVDAVSSMLYLDYNRANYKPNRYGGRENLEAIDLLQTVNRAAFALRPDVIMVAEEATTFPNITKPDFDGGLGFLFKWNMGWMNDTLRYMKTDPVYRKFEHNKLTFSLTYAFSENYILPLSHDEVVHGKLSLIGKMPGLYDQKFDNLRALLGYMMAHPGKKLTFMGSEIAQFIEWRHYESIEWKLLEYDRHRQMQLFVRDLNHFYLAHPQLWQNDQSWEGFQWVQPDASDDNILAFRRIDKRNREVLVICNFCPVQRLDYRLGVPRPGHYHPVLSTAEVKYGGTWTYIPGGNAERVPFREYNYSACFNIPPMSTTFYVRQASSKVSSTAKQKK